MKKQTQKEIRAAVKEAVRDIRRKRAICSEVKIKTIKIGGKPFEVYINLQKRPKPWGGRSGIEVNYIIKRKDTYRGFDGSPRNGGSYRISSQKLIDSLANKRRSIKLPVVLLRLLARTQMEVEKKLYHKVKTYEPTFSGEDVLVDFIAFAAVYGYNTAEKEAYAVMNEAGWEEIHVAVHNGNIKYTLKTEYWPEVDAEDKSLTILHPVDQDFRQPNAVTKYIGIMLDNHIRRNHFKSMVKLGHKIQDEMDIYRENEIEELRA